MARLVQQCVVIACVFCLAMAILDKPCNSNSLDCAADECCAAFSSAPTGYTGVCRRYTSDCTTGSIKDGECGCRPFEQCFPLIIAGTVAVTGRCIPTFL